MSIENANQGGSDTGNEIDALQDRVSELMAAPDSDYEPKNADAALALEALSAIADAADTLAELATTLAAMVAAQAQPKPGPSAVAGAGGLPQRRRPVR